MHGFQLYNNTPGGGGNSCASASCHGSDPTQNNNNVLNGANNPTIIQNAINNNKGGMGMFQGALSASDIADIAAYLGNPAAGSGPSAAVSPASLSFPSTAVGATSSSQTVTLSNSGTASLSITGIASSTADFVVTGGSCNAGGSVAANSSCTILVAFKPAGAGARSGTLSITDNAANSPSTVSLSGTGGAPQSKISLAPAALSFAAQNVGSSSAAQTVTVSNTGGAALNFSGFTMGGANAADFSRGGTCAVGTPVAAGAGCTIAVTFTPQAAGARSATLAITSDASNGTQNLGLSGTGNTTQPAASVSPASLSFGSLTVGQSGSPQTVTVTNSGTAPLQLSSIASNSQDFTIAGGSCAVGTPVPANTGSCTVLLRFVPQATGTRSGTLSIVHNAPGSPSTVALSGTGVAAAPVAQLSPATLSYSQVVGTASAAQTATLSNTGTAALSVSKVSLAGAAAADYAIASASTCAAGASVAAGSSCTIQIVFTPSTTGIRSASLSIEHNATGSPSVVTLDGSGTATPIGQVSVNAASLSFAAQSAGTVSAPQTLTVSNSGAASLSFSSISIGGADAGDFAIDAAGTTCTVRGTLAPGANCAIGVTFAPTVSAGARSGTLTIGSNASNGSVAVGLSGTAQLPAAPAITFVPTSLAFGSEPTGSISAARTAALSNSGSAPLAISSLAASPADFALTHNCPASLAAGASCTLSLTFAPVAAGARSGAVTLISNAASSPDALALTGTGVAPAPRLAWGMASSLAYPDTSVGSPSAPQSLSLTNPGTTPATIQQIQFAGTDPADFALDPSGTCPVGGTLAGGLSCNLAVVFTPAAAGARSASLNVVTDAAGLPAAALTGNGVASGVPALSLSASSIQLSGTPNAPLQPQSLVLTSSGAGVLLVNSIKAPPPLVVMDASNPNGGTCAPPPFTLQPGTSCTLMIDATDAVKAAQLQIFSNASPTPGVVTVSGTPATNVGGGGCSVGQPGRPDDPVWMLMLGAAALVLWRRRRSRVRPSR